jgi:hypothetical protein
MASLAAWRRVGLWKVLAPLLSLLKHQWYYTVAFVDTAVVSVRPGIGKRRLAVVNNQSHSLQVDVSAKRTYILRRSHHKDGV